MTRASLRLLAGWLAVALLAACETPPERPAARVASDPAAAALADAERAWEARQDARALDLFLPAARAGNAHAQMRVARLYTRNQGVPVNEAESCTWWEAAARQRESTAMVNLGLCFESGKGRPRDPAAAAQWYRQATDLGNPVAMYNLGLAYEYGRGVPQSFGEALALFQRALDSGQLRSAGDLNDARRHRDRAKRHVDAARGDPQAMYELARSVANGDGGETRDEKRGAELMRRAAEAPNAVPDALLAWGTTVYFGRHRDLSDLRPGRGLTPQQVQRMEADQREGARWVRRAADAGQEDAVVLLAGWTACGSGVSKDLAGAERLLRQSADRGSVKAMRELAEFLSTGRCGMRRDAAAAAQWQARATAIEEEALRRRTGASR